MPTHPAYANDMQNPVNIFWFRRDLRLYDNHGLYQALRGKNPVLALFIYDKKILSALSSTSDKRLVFIWNALLAINRELKKSGSSLKVTHDTACGAFEQLCTEYQVQAVYTNRDYEPAAEKRDQKVAQQLKSRGIAFHRYKDQVIFEGNEIMRAEGKPYTIFTPYSKKWKQCFSETHIEPYNSQSYANNFLLKKDFPFPALEDIGFKHPDFSLPAPDFSPEKLTAYEETRNIPAQDGTTHTGVHLRFGTVSIRHLVQLAVRYSETYLNELIWREFFMMILHHFPHVTNRSFKPAYDGIAWRNDPEEFERWCRGETGYPMVDAGMRQLNTT